MKALFLVLALGGCGCMSVPAHDATPAPTHEELRATALRLTFTEGTLCSGTAIAADLILTAEHCLDGALATVNGTKASGAVVYRDAKRDMARLRVSGIRFASWAHMGPKAKQGDRVRWFGNPNGWADIYREGYVSYAGTDYLVVSAPICHGDSGAGAFSDDGRIVGVVSAMSNEHGCTFMKANVP